MGGVVFIVVVVAMRVLFMVSNEPVLAQFSVRREFLSSALRWVAAGVAFAVWLGDGSTALAAMILITLAMPKFFARHVLVPLEVRHLPYWFVRITHLGGARGEAVFCELSSRVRSGRALEPERLARFAEEIFRLGSDGTDKAVRATSIASRAMLDALTGDREGARQLFAVCQGLRGAGPARKLSQAWRLADALARGAYGEAQHVARAKPFTVRRYLFAMLARAFASTRRPPLVRVWLLWSFCRTSRRTVRLVCHARAAALLPPLGSPDAEISAARRALFAALRRPSGAVTRGEIRRISAAWATLFESGSLLQAIEERAGALDARLDASTALAEFEAEVIDCIAELWRRSPPDHAVEADTRDTILSGALDRLESDLLDKLESLLTAVPEDADVGLLALEQHWRTWAKVRALTGEFETCLPHRKQDLFDLTGTRLISYGAALYNHAKACYLADDIFRWLRARVPKGHPDRGVVIENARLSADA